MDGIRAYIFSVTGAAVLCAIVRTIAAGKGTAWAVELVTGLVMCLAVIGPITKLELPDPEQITAEWLADGEAAAAQGEEMADVSRDAIIKQYVEAYILDKAADYSASLAVLVQLDESGTPVGVRCTGNIPAGTRAALSKIITDDLGIPEEAQIWTQEE